MTLVIDGHPFHYGMENLCRVFYPDLKIRVENEADGDPFTVSTGIEREHEGLLISVRVEKDGTVNEKTDFLSGPDMEDELEQERRMGVLLYELLSAETGLRPQWGILTGVRPVKLFGRLTERLGSEGAVRHFEQKLLVAPEKAELARLVSANEQKILDVSRPESCSLYIAIPFCPTRCAYCSFVSSSVEKSFRLIPDYVELLCGEIRRTAELAADLKLRVESVYFGGGTPTALSAEQLGKLLDTVRKSFDLSHCRELTMEAGRPDTVTREKLAAMKIRGVTRISINPQTLSDEVLHRIGRRHTTAQTLAAFDLARNHGFDNINMDLIAGLPGDSPEGFQATLDGVMQLDPESVTVHTLAMKRAARLSKEQEEASCASARDAQAMLDAARSTLLGHGYGPYYLYRQSRMIGNLENTGWAKPGFEGLYNVFIMEECHTILACGAGAVTKLRDPGSSHLERIFNFKYPYEYISRFQEMMNRKERVMNFYASLQK